MVIFSYAFNKEVLSIDVLLKRIETMAASLAKLAISAPENPGVSEASSSKSTESSTCLPLK